MNRGSRRPSIRMQTPSYTARIHLPPVSEGLSSSDITHTVRLGCLPMPLQPAGLRFVQLWTAHSLLRRLAELGRTRDTVGWRALVAVQLIALLEPASLLLLLIVTVGGVGGFAGTTDVSAVGQNAHHGLGPPCISSAFSCCWRSIVWWHSLQTHRGQQFTNPGSNNPAKAKTSR